MATQQPLYGTSVTMSTTGLASLPSNPTASFQSDRISNLSTLAMDIEITVKITTAVGAPANDKCAYVWVCPWTNNADGSWIPAMAGYGVPPSGSASAIGIIQPHDLRLLGVMNYTTNNQNLQNSWFLSNAFGPMPDAFSLMVTNFTGVTFGSTASMFYRPINYTIS